ncbi:hypothetical protein Pcinc_042238 [Petrolisthes cinctipes]|uniref:EGF-like calcium-binding domain-containing protein n=1 Tax=Petrolisthes cinctipes TaxID=88211 RepID=A0AAE1EHJ8_PETCI|nr:hypothetical protein Pcinc_042238 [Petrolisthes cinctipes]
MDGTDESETQCQSYKGCLNNSTQYQCAGGHCISKDFVCDGKHDCPLNDDEEDCGGHCISKDFVCDGKHDCPLNDDEEECGGHCISKDFVCDGKHDCPLNDDEDDCDINECKSDILACDHYCTNLPGSYTCTCQQHYTLQHYDNVTCKSTGV